MSKNEKAASITDNAKRTNLFLIAPELLTVVTDPGHPLYDERIHLPLEENLVLNIMAHGVKQVINCRRTTNDTLEVVDGRRRALHAVEANVRLTAEGKEPIGVRVALERAEDKDLFGMTVLMNEHRVDDSVIIKGQKASRLLAMGKTEDEIAIIFGVNKKTIDNWLLLIEASSDIKKAVQSGLISVSAAMPLARLSRDEQKDALRNLKEAHKEVAPESPQKKISAKQVKKHVEGASFSKPGTKEIKTAMDILDEDKDAEGVKLLQWVLGDISSKEALGIDIEEYQQDKKAAEAKQKEAKLKKKAAKAQAEAETDIRTYA